MKLLVSGVKYITEHTFAEVYEGKDEVELYIKIAHDHCHDQFNDSVRIELTPAVMRADLKMRNGDGCDYITCIVEIEGACKIVF